MLGAKAGGTALHLAAGTAALDRADLDAMLAAGDEILECRRVLRKGGLNVVGEMLRGEATFVEYDHYPADDVFDRDTHAQYFYHAHRGLEGEHGHFHTFLRPPGMPPGVRPVAHDDGEPWPDGAGALSHLVGISMDAYGDPIGLFTTNRWVTGEAWCAAADVARMLERFRIDHAAPSWPANRWITAMFVLFRPQMVALLRARDAAIAQWSITHPEVDAVEDRGLEIASQMRISVEEQIQRLRQMRGRSIVAFGT
jgi:hypothetical protein